MSSAREVHRIYTGYSFKWIGAFSFDVTDDGATNAYTITISSGRYYHAIDDTSDPHGHHESFRAKLQSELNSATGSPGDWVVEFGNTSIGFAIYRSGTPTFTATLNTVAQNVLGMGASLNTGTAASDVRPYYVHAPDDPYLGNARGNHEPNDFAETYRTDGGDGFSVEPTSVPKMDRWKLRGEPDAVTHKHAAASDPPWTWEHLYEHCRGNEPMVLVDNAGSINSDGDIPWSSANLVMRCKLTDVAFRPQETIPNRHTLWDVPFDVLVTKRF